MENFLTAKDLACLFNVRLNTIYVWVARREIPFIKLPGDVTRFPKKEVEDWLKKRTAKGKGVGQGVYLNPPQAEAA